MCVVDPRRARNSACARACASSITWTSAARSAARRLLQPRERVGEERPARTGRRVREDGPPAVGDLHGLPRHRGVRGEVLAHEQAAALGHVRADGRGDVTRVEGRRAVAREALERVRQDGVAVGVADPRPVPGRLVAPPRAAGVAWQIGSRISNRYACCALTSTPARACATAGATSAESGSRAVALGACAPPDRAVRPPPRRRRCGSPGSRRRRSRRRPSPAARAVPCARPRPGAATKKSSRTAPCPAGDQHVAARAEPREERLGDERGEHRRQRGVDRVAAGAEELRAARAVTGWPAATTPRGTTPPPARSGG